MLNVAIYAPENCFASSVIGPMDVFNVANSIWRHFNHDIDTMTALYNCYLVTDNGDSVTASSGVCLESSYSITSMPKPDIFLIGATHFKSDKLLLDYIDSMKVHFPRISAMEDSGTQIVSFCSASFIPAAAGLLDDKKATTSWWLKQLFVKNFPQIELTFNELVVRSGNFWTAGATTSYLSLCIKLIEHCSGTKLAQQVSRILLVDSNQLSQLPYMSLQTILPHDDAIIARCQHWLQDNLSKSISVDQMAQHVAMSKRNFIRRFKEAQGDTPANYLRQLRVESAKQYLVNTQMRFEDIVVKVGYEDSSAFRRVFTQATSLTPNAYRQKFSSQALT